jgi:GntR family transcriptional regulator/MocR family aminotransferase
MVTRGSQMAIYLAAATLVSPGDAVAVEEPGYPYAWEAFRAAGARVIGIPVDTQGIDVAQLESVAQQEPRLKALYVTPHHQYPTTVTLGASRRLRLLEVARRYGLTIVEDDYDHEYRFDGRPILPLASRANDEVPVIYIGSLSKLLSPAVRLGYASARPEILQRMIKRREAIDRQGDLLLENAMAELISNGTLSRHAKKARRVYEARRNFLVEELRMKLDQEIDFNTPSGGLAVWLRVHEGLSANDWAASALSAGVMISPPSSFMLESSNTLNGLRIGYANLDEAGIRSLVKTLVDCRPWT